MNCLENPRDPQLSDTRTLCEVDLLRIPIVPQNTRHSFVIPEAVSFALPGNALKTNPTEEPRRKWLEDNREAFEECTKHFEKYGLWNDGFQMF